MKKLAAVIGGVLIVSLLGSNFAAASGKQAIDPADYSDLRAQIKAIKAPKLVQPTWLKKQLAAEKAAAAGAHRSATAVTVTYDVTTRGTITADFAQFKTLANQTLNDPRGWARLNVQFTEVASGGMFTLVLAQANQLPTFSSGCSADWSCTAGRYVIINQDRWEGTTTSWNNAGGSLRDYRHMVVNHETGHWLGHDHQYCSGAGQLAPIMQQQSIDLQGCKFNPWPLPSELWSSRLGI
jgi:hypothetical protein